MADRRDYQERIRARAYQGWDIKWLRNISISALAGFGGAYFTVGRVSGRTLILTWLFAAAFFALWELMAYLHRRFYLAPFSEHEERLGEISALELELTSQKKSSGRLSQEVEVLKSQLAEREKDQGLADYLTERHAYGIRELLCKPPDTTPDSIAEWRRRENDFSQGVLSEMQLRGCTLQDIHHVEYIGGFAPGGFHFHDVINLDLSMFKTRLDRIADVSTKYAPD